MIPLILISLALVILVGFNFYVGLEIFRQFREMRYELNGWNQYIQENIHEMRQRLVNVPNQKSLIEYLDSLSKISHEIEENKKDLEKKKWERMKAAFGGKQEDE